MLHGAPLTGDGRAGHDDAPILADLTKGPQLRPQAGCQLLGFGLGVRDGLIASLLLQCLRIGHTEGDPTHVVGTRLQCLLQ